jgi:hypothetical protein
MAILTQLPPLSSYMSNKKQTKLIFHPKAVQGCINSKWIKQDDESYIIYNPEGFHPSTFTRTKQEAEFIFNNYVENFDNLPDSEIIQPYKKSTYSMESTEEAAKT